MMDIDIKIYIKDNKSQRFIGRGPIELLENIESTGSIRKASHIMEMSYSKAHKIIIKLEKTIGKKVLKRKIGGESGGGACLTDQGKKIIDEYRKLERNINKYASKKFSESEVFSD